MTIRCAEANSNVRQINDLPIDHRAVAGDSNRHLLHRNQTDPQQENACEANLARRLLLYTKARRGPQAPLFAITVRLRLVQSTRQISSWTEPGMKLSAPLPRSSMYFASVMSFVCIASSAARLS